MHVRSSWVPYHRKAMTVERFNEGTTTLMMMVIYCSFSESNSMSIRFCPSHVCSSAVLGPFRAPRCCALLLAVLSVSSSSFLELCCRHGPSLVPLGPLACESNPYLPSTPDPSYCGQGSISNFAPCRVSADLGLPDLESALAPLVPAQVPCPPYSLVRPFPERG